MGKIEDAQNILQKIGLPPAQYNRMSALTLLSLAQLAEDTPWSQASTRSMRIHDILESIKEQYFEKGYAENTRETIRRQVIHQFVQAGIAIRNPDDPSLATNSPRTHYILSEPALNIIRTYGTDEWEGTVARFLEQQGALFELYQRPRNHHKVPLTLADGRQFELSPGKHNELQVQIVMEFGAIFATGAVLIYFGDTAKKNLIQDNETLNRLGVPVTKHDKLPDVVLYDENKNWLFLIEAVTSHGPVSPKRFVELEDILRECTVQRIYISAFPDFGTFKEHSKNIAWETEVWIADIPEHMIHFNGDRFLGPH